MAISDYQNGRVVTTVPIGAGVDGAGYDPASGNVFASNADGTLTVIHQDSPDKYHVVQNIETPRGIAQYGPRSDKSSPVCGVRQVRPGACWRQKRAGDCRLLCNVSDRAMIHWLLGRCRSVESLAFALAFGMVDDKPDVKRSET